MPHWRVVLKLYIFLGCIAYGHFILPARQRMTTVKAELGQVVAQSRSSKPRSVTHSSYFSGFSAFDSRGMSHFLSLMRGHAFLL